MANYITENQRDKMRYRRMTLKDKLRKIEQRVMGRAQSYLPLICDEGGHVDKEKTERFVEEMLGALKRYAELDPRREALGKETLEMYESFLYCAVMSLGFERSRRDSVVKNWRISSVFEDIIRRAEKTDIYGCGGYGEYLKDCYRAYRAACGRRDEFLRSAPYNVFYHLPPALSEKDSDFFIEVKQSLDELGFPPFVECLPEKTLLMLSRAYDGGDNFAGGEAGEKPERAVVPETKSAPNAAEPVVMTVSYEEYDEEYDDDEIPLDEDELPADVQDALYEARVEALIEREENERIDEELEALDETETYADSKALSNTPPERIRQREQSKSEDEFIAVKAAWINKIVFDRNTLCGHFYRFMQLFFDCPDRRYFVEDIENMVDTFLFEHGISAFSLGDDYVMVNFYVDKMTDRIEREIERGRKR